MINIRQKQAEVSLWAQTQDSDLHTGYSRNMETASDKTEHEQVKHLCLRILNRCDFATKNRMQQKNANFLVWLNEDNNSQQGNTRHCYWSKEQCKIEKF